ncbi:response regulator transcription factor [Peptostreptococcus equinus]|uniref:Stage 0 sporulation protein A homolog n=1 Tax=Peptostreptococcus equinus TaxID=3003601 RepID=A0ABY7JTZ7_9FIRM|nr:response regulator transcription factor [Peptostreptococcus sp. CBA3647]WAW15543.1 response regulator transcription factor [Peptostreptococcus sp. CBA3647]
MIKALIVDDNKQITEVLKSFALKEGIQVDLAYDGEEAWNKFQDNKYDILLLDIMMPKMDGYELLKKIRKISMVPVILITAKGEDYERIMGLDYGADDYIVKPFSVAEVMARIRAILRRIDIDTNSIKVVKVDNLYLNLDEYSCKLDNKEIQLTKREFEILWMLAENKDKVFIRDNILDSLWGMEYFGDTRTVDTHIKRLRAKLNSEKNKWRISTVRGVGYKFEV